MARIRSVHPGLATDEIYMAMSAFAKAAWPLLWTECDDQGAFEWKPIVLKARLLPADAVDFATILEEWVRLGAVMSYELDGRQLGLVRNFQRYQRPKKPKYTHVIPDEFRTFVGSRTEKREQTHDDVVKVPPKGGTGTELSPQRKEEGGRKKERTSLRSVPKKATRLADDWQPSTEDLAYAEQRAMPESEIPKEIERFRNYWIAKSGATAVKRDWPATWRNWVLKACDDKGYAPKTNGSGNGHAAVEVNEFGEAIDWAKRAEYYRRRGDWPERWGPMENIPPEFARLFEERKPVVSSSTA